MFLYLVRFSHIKQSWVKVSVCEPRPEGGGKTLGCSLKGVVELA